MAVEFDYDKPHLTLFLFRKTEWHIILIKKYPIQAIFMKLRSNANISRINIPHFNLKNLQCTSAQIQKDHNAKYGETTKTHKLKNSTQRL